MHVVNMRHSILKVYADVTNFPRVACSLKAIVELCLNKLCHALFLFTDLILAESNSSSVSINQGTTFITGPYLDGNGISNVTTQISTHAYLPCKVSIHCFSYSKSFHLLETISNDFSSCSVLPFQLCSKQL